MVSCVPSCVLACWLACLLICLLTWVLLAMASFMALAIASHCQAPHLLAKGLRRLCVWKVCRLSNVQIPKTTLSSTHGQHHFRKAQFWDRSKMQVRNLAPGGDHEKYESGPLRLMPAANLGWVVASTAESINLHLPGGRLMPGYLVGIGGGRPKLSGSLRVGLHGWFSRIPKVAQILGYQNLPG